MRIRVWPAVLVLVAGSAWITRIWLDDQNRQARVMGTIGTSILMLLALVLWLAFFSRLPRGRRFAAAGIVLAAMAAMAGMFRIRGVTGDLLPILEPRWASAGEAAPAPGTLAAPPAIEPAGGAYPQFLGPDRDATLEGPRLARDWSAHPPRRLWRQPVGEAWSGFAVTGALAITQEQHGREERVVAYDLATGRPVWSHADDARYSTVIAGTGPRATPTLTGGRAFTLGATGILNALDAATGQRLWSRDIVKDNEASMPEWGKACSPLVVDGRVIVSAGGANGRSLVAYDAASGERVWTAGTGRSSYSSPALMTLGGRPQVVILNSSSVAGHDPASGSLLWEQPFPGQQPNVAVPIPLAGDQVLVSAGYGIGSKAYRVAGNGPGLQATLVWESPRLKSKFANMIAHGGSVYGLDDGVLTCINPADGERRWKGGRYGHGQILLVGDLLIVQTEEGEIVLVEATPEAHREITRFAVLDGKTWNPPALAGRVLLVRNDREAAAYELPVE
jgi:outer membrane protein assembly factor BamB